jgi:membrane-associated phospholipid phosphatase
MVPVAAWGAGHLILLAVLVAAGADERISEGVCRWGDAPTVDAVMRQLSALGNPVPVTTVALCTAVTALLVRRRGDALVLVAAPWAATVACTQLKEAVRRPRPSFSCLQEAMGGYGFPSGHAVGVTVGFVLPVGWILIRYARGSRVVAGGVMLLAEGVILSRVALGAHHLVDVLAGQVLGVLWLLLGFEALHRIDWWSGRRRRPVSFRPPDFGGQGAPGGRDTQAEVDLARGGHA